MKILNISTVELDKNGVSRCILSYFEKICSSTIQVDIVAPNIVSDDIKELIKSKKAYLYELPLRKKNTVKYFFTLIKIIKQEKYDIVHAHGNSCTLAIELLAAKIAGCNIRIAHSHSTSCKHQKANKILRPIFELSCTDRFACGEKAGKWLFRNKKFKVIYNSVDIEKYKPNDKIRKNMRSKLDIHPNDFLLGHVGAFNDVKNHDFMVNLIKKLNYSDYKRKYKLILIGDGENKKNIEQKVLDNNLIDSVKFTGNVSNVTEYLQAIDLFLLPSIYEGVPYVLIEAQASGINCIVSKAVSKEADVTGNVKFIDLNVQEWINEIENSPKEKNSHVDINEKYDLNKNSIKLIELYKEIYNGENVYVE